MTAVTIAPKRVRLPRWEHWPVVAIQSSILPRARPLLALDCFWYTITQL